MSEGVRVEGLDEVLRKFNHLANGAVIRNSLKAYAHTVEGDVKPYPALSEANAEPVPYYIRGRGTMTAGGLRRTSQNMDEKWRVKSAPKQTELGNEATYSGYVQGVNQARFHAARGWKNAKKRAEQMLRELEKIVRFEVDKEWRRG